LSLDFYTLMNRRHALLAAKASEQSIRDFLMERLALKGKSDIDVFHPDHRPRANLKRVDNGVSVCWADTDELATVDV
jgi:hypothetical protein